MHGVNRTNLPEIDKWHHDDEYDKLKFKKKVIESLKSDEFDVKNMPELTLVKQDGKGFWVVLDTNINLDSSSKEGCIVQRLSPSDFETICFENILKRNGPNLICQNSMWQSGKKIIIFATS